MEESQINILVVGDEQAGHETLEGLLANRGYNLIFARNGEEALAGAGELVPDLILLDVTMPGMDGFEVCRRLRASGRLAEVPIVMVTAPDDQKSRIRGLEAGADDFVSRPFDHGELQARVRSLLRLGLQRKMFKLELQAERDLARSILDALGEAVVVTDLQGTIKYVNPAAVVLTGFTANELTGQNWRVWQSEEQPGDPYDRMVQVVRSGRTWRGEVIGSHRDGTLYNVMLTVAPLFSEGSPGRPVGFAGVLRDVSYLPHRRGMLKGVDPDDAGLLGRVFDAPEGELSYDAVVHKALECAAALERAEDAECRARLALDRLRGTFLGTVNHEMRTPLALIFQVLGMLEDRRMGELTDQQLDAVAVLRRQMETLDGMVEGLTRVAAFLGKQEPVRPVLARLEPVFENVIPLAAFKARSREIEIETDIALDLPAFPLDVKQVEEAVTQLVDNAIKFNHPGGRVRIAAYTKGGYIVISVSDTGIGIEPGQMDMIWEVFEQGADPLRRAQEGLGLGLVLVRHIVEAHNGTIEVDTTPGEGSTFTIRLPRTRRAGRGKGVGAERRDGPDDSTNRARDS